MIADAAQASALAQLARSPGSPALPSALSQLGCPSSSYSPLAAAASHTTRGLVDAVAFHHLKQQMIVAVVDMDADNDRARRVERLLHDRRDIAGRLNQERSRRRPPRI
jgi:hypothetical protein